MDSDGRMRRAEPARSNLRKPMRKQERRRVGARCRFCREKVTRIDYKDIDTLSKLLTSQGKMFSRKRAGNCAKHQRMVKRAVKQGRVMALLPYIG